MTKHEIQILRRELARHERGRGKRYDAGLKARVIAFANARRADGETFDTVAASLGLAQTTIQRWCGGVRVEDEEACSALLPVVVLESARTTNTVTLVSPSGFRLEGLELTDAVSMLRALR